MITIRGYDFGDTMPRSASWSGVGDDLGESRHHDPPRGGRAIPRDGRRPTAHPAPPVRRIHDDIRRHRWVDGASSPDATSAASWNRTDSPRFDAEGATSSCPTTRTIAAQVLSARGPTRVAAVRSPCRREVPSVPPRRAAAWSGLASASERSDTTAGEPFPRVLHGGFPSSRSDRSDTVGRRTRDHAGRCPDGFEPVVQP
jgi:hypothetical protein